MALSTCNHDIGFEDTQYKTQSQTICGVEVFFGTNAYYTGYCQIWVAEGQKITNPTYLGKKIANHMRTFLGFVDCGTRPFYQNGGNKDVESAVNAAIVKSFEG